MNTNLTDITVILDRSGSMAACQQEAENGLNHFVETQKNNTGEANFSLVQFDTEYEFIHRGVPIKDVSKLNLIPRGLTALLDAVGRVINETGERLSKIAEAQRPGLVVFVIITDGQENSSHEFTKAQIKQMIEHQQKVYNWQFTFLGANQDAFAEAQGLGIPRNAVANYTVNNAQAAFRGASMNVSRMRNAVHSGQTVQSFYTDEEQINMIKSKS